MPQTNQDPRGLINCAICRIQFDNDIWTLPFTHYYHLSCIRQWYDWNVNRIDGRTHQRIYPRCPDCRARLHQRDEPRRSKVVNQALLNEPAYCGMPIDQRPFRFSRETVILDKKRNMMLIEQLVATKIRMEAAK